MIKFCKDRFYVFFLDDCAEFGPETTQEQAEQAYLSLMKKGLKDPEQLKIIEDWCERKFGQTDRQMDPTDLTQKEAHYFLGSDDGVSAVRDYLDSPKGRQGAEDFFRDLNNLWKEADPGD